MTAKPATLCAALWILAAASAAPQNGQLSLGGTVTNSATGEPVEHALVQILHYVPPQAVTPGQRPVPPPPFVARAFTDSGGGFRFTGLAAGNYLISAQKPQFTADPNSPNNTVELSGSTPDVKLKLSPLAVITGKVMDQDGQPLWDASVVAVSVQVVDGLRQTTNDRTVSTDDRGMFRLWNLQPGRYFLKAAGYGGGTHAYVGDNLPQFFGDRGFAPAYLGGGKKLDSATALEIGPGSETHADLKVQIEPAHAVRGVLGNFVPHRTVRFELLQNGESLPASPVSVNSETGRFEIQSVVNGGYILHATQDDATADVPVNMSGTDLEGLAPTLLPGVDLKVVTLDSSPPAEPASSGEQPPMRLFCTVALHPADGRSNLPLPMSRPGANGEGTIHGVTAGLYRAAPSCFGGHIQSAMLGSQDLLLNPMVKIDAGGEPPAIQIAAMRGGGTIAGKLTLEKPEKPDNLTVLIVPQFAESTGPQESPVMDFSEEGSGLMFSFANLAPGAYTVYAFAGREQLEFRNSKFLQTLTGGVSVQVENNAEKNITLTEVIR